MEFNSKSFNPQAFGAYVQTIPKTNLNELIKSKAIVRNLEIDKLLKNQTGSYFGTIPMYGRIGGKALNYDGQTDIVANTTKTFEKNVIAIGRANAWSELDFSSDITGGVDFMGNVARQINAYWEEIDQKTLLCILKGIFSMTEEHNEKFVNSHTLDISGEKSTASKVSATTLNNAIQKACGDNKSKFSLVIMHSAVATNLENLNLLEYMKYTDENGIQRDLALATWNGKTVLIDDAMPTEDATPDTKYTTYILGEGAIEYSDLGAKVPYEMARDAKTKGGQDILYSRTRKCFSPFGISYTKSSQTSLSPTDEELENGANWCLVSSADNSGKVYIDHKAIPIARIISKG